jgi:hypothetical protein
VPVGYDPASALFVFNPEKIATKNTEYTKGKKFSFCVLCG